MPVVTILPGGTSGGHTYQGLRKPGKRGEIKGWSRGAARRLVAWLWSVNAELLGDDGWALTLTCGVTPDSADDWTLARERWLDRMRSRGMHRYQWLTEWTARGRPHMHLAVYAPGRFDIDALIAWLDICDEFGWPASARGQHIVPISGATGWLQYVSKHAARGVVHYQRDGAPEGWTKTGALWRAGGDWPLEEPERHEISVKQFAEFRHRFQQWMLDDMRRREMDADYVEETATRWANPEHGEAQGVSGWIDGLVSYQILLDVLDEFPSTETE